jgi:hypothetical protein
MFLNNTRKKKDDGKLVDLLKRHCESEEILFQLFEKREIDIEELISKVNVLKNLRAESLKYLNINENNQNNEQIQNIILVQDRDLSKELQDSYTIAKEEIVSVYKTIEKDEVPVLNLSLIKDFILQISKLLKEDIEFPNADIDSKILVLISNTNNTNKINKMILQNKKKVIITSRNYNFENYTHDELLEILRFFDVCVSDTSFDHIRTEIVKQINSISLTK